MMRQGAASVFMKSDFRPCRFPFNPSFPKQFLCKQCSDNQWHWTCEGKRYSMMLQTLLRSLLRWWLVELGTALLAFASGSCEAVGWSLWGSKALPRSDPLCFAFRRFLKPGRIMKYLYIYIYFSMTRMEVLVKLDPTGISRSLSTLSTLSRWLALRQMWTSVGDYGQL